MTPAARLIKSYREGRGILRFVDEQFKVELDAWQEEALLAFASPDEEMRRISLQACAGPGKSAVLAWCAWWFISCWGERVEHPKGAAVAITRDNLKDNFWAELAKWHNVSPYLSNAFTWTSGRIFANDHPETWFISARSWPKSASADEQGKTLSGLHSKYVAVFVDESGAIPTTVLRAAEQALSRAAFGKIIQAGNPISLEGMLYAAATALRHLWTVLKVTGDPKNPKAWVNSPRLGDGPRKWAEEQIETYGRDNPWVKAYILGEFPPASINQLLSLEEVEAAMNLKVRPESYANAEKRLGVDVARFGDDRTVIFPRQGICAFKPVVMRAANTTNIAARVMMAEDQWGSHLTLIDDSGHWGHGVYDNMLTAGRNVLAVLFEDKAIDPRYGNRRAEMWLEMAKAIRHGTKLPKIEGLVGELTAPTYTFVGGKFMLEPKDQIKKRLGHSPDLADGLALTYALPDRPAPELARWVRGGRAKTMDDVERENER